ncbi:MAG: tRNA (cytosine(32)/uridine(32)-2'-O)-methyltransferase TrmJ, partial [Proteobacteria bacterium]|nr:tRNA (cytosine(32)/uridine(32)-2'-O)-methyltransferase TrmJ [Pseudomonadota bacterium]
DQMEHFYEHLEQTMIDVDFHDPDNPRQLMTRLRRLFSRTRLDKMELSILRGILTNTQRNASIQSSQPEDESKNI